MENKPKREYRRHHGSLFWPLLLIAAGIFLLLNTTNIIEGSPWQTLLQLWPLLLIVAGLDGIYRQDGLVGAIILIGTGTIFLLSNLGIVVIGSWMMLLRFWPVLLIAFGLDLIIGSRSVASAILGTLAGIVLLAAVVWFAIISPGGIKPTLQQETVTQPLQGATQVDVAITASVGSLSIADGTAQDLLLDGKVSLPGNEQVETRYTLAGTKGRLRVESSGNLNYFYPTISPEWDFKLNAQPEMDLQTKLIVGEQNIDLQELDIQSFKSETVIGRTVLTLPDKDLSRLEVNVTIGQLVIFIPSETGLTVDLDTGITGITIPEGYTRQEGQIRSNNYQDAPHKIHISIDQPIGNLVIKSGV